MASGDSTLEIRLDKPDGPLLGRVKVSATSDWKIAKVRAKRVRRGVHDLLVTQVGAKPVEVDWISFR